jgi:hypothetical protein
MVISAIKLKMQEITAESLSLATSQRKTVTQLERFLNMLEKVPTDNNLSDKPGNISPLMKVAYRSVTNLTLQ